MTLLVKIELPANAGPYEALVKQTNGNPDRILVPGDAPTDIWVHSGNHFSVTELPKGSREKLEQARRVLGLNNSAKIAATPDGIQFDGVKLTIIGRDQEIAQRERNGFITAEKYGTLRQLPNEIGSICSLPLNEFSVATERIVVDPSIGAADNDFPLGQACDLSGEGGCEVCQ